MIDARDQVGVPIITDCPLYVTAFGVMYEVAADAFVFRAGPIVFEENCANDLMSTLRSYAPYAVHRSPRGFSPGGLISDV